MDNIIKWLLDNGWSADGQTITETVRIPTVRSPVFGGTGGELATFGGRQRFRKGSQFCTVGKRTVNFYELGPHGAVNMEQARTNNPESVYELATRRSNEQVTGSLWPDCEGPGEFEDPNE